MPTIKDIAELANVSPATVSRVLNNSGYVSSAARKRVIEAIEKTNYVPSEHAKSLRTKKTQVIGVVMPRLSTETSSRVVHGIDKVLSAKGYQILLATSDLSPEKEIDQLRLLQSKQVEGIIFLATNVSENLQKELSELETPLVALGQDLPGVSTVLYDDYHAACDVVDWFLAKGHTKIGFIGVSAHDEAVGRKRRNGYQAQMNEAALPVEKSWMQEASFDIESGYEATRRMFKESTTTPTAIFAVTDRLAVGAMEYIKQAGMSIPEDVALAGIGASEIGKYVTPPLATVDYANEEAGMKATNLLLDHISNGDNSHKKFVMPYGLLARDSLG
ncbi:LacI family DNA-binding transcriptional regulator [Salsuginibacillus kocurii]|uniref:LacI family DNA-binding transcriptional regulator n=1 Tax=Salsuginibacillus kocurii TaxID=427078 RepID=UPI000360FC3D|nr:LacI family DNA-binding transcriptional regulator [Salsuginibacillus kocurii]